MSLHILSNGGMDTSFKFVECKERICEAEKDYVGIIFSQCGKPLFSIFTCINV